MGCNRQVILRGIHIPKTDKVHSDQGFGCDFGCDWERPLGPGQVWLELIQVGVLRSPRRGRWSKPRGEEVWMTM